MYTEDGLRKVDEWKRVWILQDQEDAWRQACVGAEARGETPPKLRLADPEAPERELDSIPVPPPFEKHDFVKSEFFSARGKLNVGRERFVLFADLTPHRYGWSGWRGRERALAQVEAFSIAENDPQAPLPAPTPDEPRRCGVTLGLWESLPDVRRWGSTEEHGELLALAREACRQPRCPCPVVQHWRAQELNGQPDNSEQRRAKKRPPVVGAVSLAQRAWVASLFQVGKELDLAGVWACHRVRMSESGQLAISGVDESPVQLTMPIATSGGANEQTSMDLAQLALVLDDLVASGDLQLTGRGKKKRFQLVARGVAS
ncbi:MAG: hypothetical protein ABSF69_24825 [Polyangiaceae bacterium]